MLAQSLILLTIAAHDLALALLQGYADVERRVQAGIVALKHHVRLTMANDSAVVARGGETAAHAQVVDGVEHIGLALSVVADKAIQLGREVQSGLTDVLVIDYGGSIQCHDAKVLLFPDLHS